MSKCLECKKNVSCDVIGNGFNIKSIVDNINDGFYNFYLYSYYYSNHKKANIIDLNLKYKLKNEEINKSFSILFKHNNKKDNGITMYYYDCIHKLDNLYKDDKLNKRNYKLFSKFDVYEFNNNLMKCINFLSNDVCRSFMKNDKTLTKEKIYSKCSVTIEKYRIYLANILFKCPAIISSKRKSKTTKFRMSFNKFIV